MQTMQPKIAIGCPVRNRAWVLPEYLWALEQIDYENRVFMFLENDSTDDTWLTLGDWCKRITRQRKGGVRLTFTKTGSDHWQRGAYAHNQYENLANVRNQFLEMFLRTDADFLLSVDSDVIVPPDIVTRLLADADWVRFIDTGKEYRSIVGAAISNVPDKPLDGMTPGNFMKSSGGEAFHHAPYPLTGLHKVDLIGAVYLIPRQAIVDGAHYAPHPQGEDAPFCQQAQALGYRLLVDMDVKCEHRMVKPKQICKVCNIGDVERENCDICESCIESMADNAGL